MKKLLLCFALISNCFSQNLLAQTLGEALGIPELPLRIIPESSWYPIHIDGQLIAASIGVTNQRTALLQTEVQGPGKLTFTKSGYSLIGLLNGVDLRLRIYDSWFPHSVFIPEGFHLFEWSVSGSTIARNYGYLRDI